MKIRSPHNLTNFFFFTGIILQSSLAQQTPDLASQIEGEWIIYRGDNFEICVVFFWGVPKRESNEGQVLLLKKNSVFE